MCKLFQIIFHNLWLLSSIPLLFILLAFWFYGYFIGFIVFVFWLLGLLYTAQDIFLYYPNDPTDSRFKIIHPSKYNMPFESIKINTKDGVKIHMFFIKQLMNSNHLPTLIFFHGNAGNIGQRLLNVLGFYENLNINILLVEYRGYGLSEGIPSEQGFYHDAEASFDYIMHRNDIDTSKIIIFGRSLGGAVAIDLVSKVEHKIKIWALIVENTFTSIPEMARIIIKWSWLKSLPNFCYKNKYMSLSKIGQLKTPTLIICGLSDILVPPSMSNELYVQCAAICKKLVVINGGGHNDTWISDNYYSAIQDFLQEIPQQPMEIGPYFDNYQDNISHDLIRIV